MTSTSTQTGQHAEEVAVQFLRTRYFQIVARNWRTRYCEVDIIAFKDQMLNFVEVKYRRSSAQGAGLDYITPQKLRKMQLAATFWAAKHHWRGQFQLAALEVSGSDFVVTAFVPIL